ncbi:DUF2199 domain-containing protein [Edaphobacter flagellatus]|uniref:DUF2199 domain-containing protein n=1 Tax=Edaphobacter flagellatus TaxID=1933044 RepID=UPI0036F3F9B0
MSYICSTCGSTHDGPPYVWGVPSPDAWAELSPEEQNERGECSSDQCVIDDEQFFVIGRIEIPVSGSTEPFAWLAWVEVGVDDFVDIRQKWFIEGRETTPAYAGRLANKLPTYSQSTLGLQVNLITNPLPNRPSIHLVDEHAIRDEQAKGITEHRVAQIASLFRH